MNKSALRYRCLSLAGTLVLAFGLLGWPPQVAHAAWPERPIRLVVAFDAGGTADRIARVLADPLTAALGTSIVVENRAGSSGTIGSAFVARAAPDGYTLLIGGSGPHITAPVINPNTGYDPLRDFTHVAMIAGDTYVLAAAKSAPFKSLAELITAARAASPPIAYGSPGAGSLGHLIMAGFVAKAGAPFAHVPYRGGGPAINDVLGGHIATVMLPVINVGELIKAGTLVPLAVSAAERHQAYPAIPTFIEQGFAVEGTTWFWLAGPRYLPADIVARLEQATSRALTVPEVKASFEAQALLLRPLAGAELTKFLAAEIATWSRIVKETGFKLE